MRTRSAMLLCRLPFIRALLALAVLLAYAPQAAAQCVPRLRSPAPGAVLDNGRSDGLDETVWSFDWSDCPGASHYHLYVIGPSALNPVINENDLRRSSYRERSTSYGITTLYGWTWKVRARVGGQWGPWSPARSFDVEPRDSDPPGIPGADPRRPLISAQACLGIGNIEGEGPVHCEGPGGRDFGKAGGKTFLSGVDDVWVLLRFRNLERRRHRIQTYVWTGDRPPFNDRQAAFDQRLPFRNRSESWSFWFKTRAGRTGYWRVGIVLDNHLVGEVVYRVDSLLE